ncbi:MAG: hypothetical protein Fur0034_04170 [Desulfuromonadia bacterium]
MFTGHHDLGASLFATWSDSRKEEEIEKLVQGYRNGVPVGILIKMSETIAGSEKQAKRILRRLLTRNERRRAIREAQGGMKLLVTEWFE